VAESEKQAKLMHQQPYPMRTKEGKKLGILAVVRVGYIYFGVVSCGSAFSIINTG
ncbi:hypothetical protein ACTXT7_008761, partial [Hymenolepis weldensis]